MSTGEGAPPSIEQLHEEARRFRLTFERAPVAMAHLGLAGEWMVVNDRLCTLLGHEQGELIGTRMQDQTLPEDVRLDLDLLVRLIAGEIDSYTVEKRFRRGDGAVVRGRLHLSLVRSPSDDGVTPGAPRYAIAVIEDVAAHSREADERAARQAAEAAGEVLRANERRLSTALATASDAVWELNAERQRLTVIGAWPAKLGHDADALGDDPAAWLALVAPADRDRLLYQLEALQRGRLALIECELRAQDASGAWRWTLLRGQLVATENDDIERPIAGTIADITERVQLEEDRRALLQEAEHTRAELEISNDRLRMQALALAEHAESLRDETSARDEARRVAEAALAAAELARAAAQEANRAKAQFLATMSHELRTPLNAIQGYTQLMQLGIYGPVSDEQHAALDRIDTSQRFLLGLIADVLNFAKIESGRLEVSARPLEVAGVLERAIALVEPQAAEKGVVLALDPTSAGATAIADPERLQQVLLNLLTNAIKFTAAERELDGQAADGRIDVRAVLGTEYVAIHVRDNGRGIAPRQVASIFDPFVQVDRHLTTGSQQGVGLGLAISRELARAMGGDLEVHSVVGEGSTFTITLPRAGTGTASA